MLQAFTLEAWVQRTGAGYGFSTDPSGAAIIAKPQEGASGSNIASWHLHWTNNGEIHFNLVHTPTSSGVYLLSSATPTPNDVLIGADNFAFGYLRRFDGYIDDVRVWDHARSAALLSQWMNCRLTGSEQGLVGYWPFDAANLTDATGHGHDGAISGVAGSATYGPLAALGDCSVGVGDRPGASMNLAAMSVFPQSARERFTVSFDLPRPSAATLEIVDVAGRRLAALASDDFPAGRHEITRDTATLGAERRSAGVLFARLRWDGGTSVRPLVLRR